MTFAQSEPALRIGLRLFDGANFDSVIERVEYGGFSAVAFGPNRLRNGQLTAYKTLRRDLLDDPPTRSGFVRECLLWNSLWPHPNITSAYAVLEMDDSIGARPFLALEYAQRGSLRPLLRAAQRTAEERLPLAAGLFLAQQIAAGLSYLHTPDPAYLRDEPTVHRDFKPENVLLMGDGRAAITDFGLAKAVESSPVALSLLLNQAHPRSQIEEAILVESEVATQTTGLHTGDGIVLGTLPYMPPEQWAYARYTTTAADIYAMGIMLSELLAGRHALLDLEEPHTQGEWQQAHQNPQPRPINEVVPGVPNAIEDVYRHCLARNPDNRPTAGDVLSALQSWAVTEGLEVYYPPEMVPHTPGNEMAYWHSTSLAYLAFQMYDDARARVDRALAVSGDAWEILNTKGNILASMGLAEAALQTYHAALDAMPAEAALGQKTVRTNLGELLSMEGKYSEADAYFAQALEALPSSDVALQRALNYRYWALAEFEQRRLEEAERLAGQGIATADLALQMDPTNPTAPKLLAALRLFVALRLGATDSAP